MKKISSLLLAIFFIIHFNVFSQTGWIQVYNGGLSNQNKVQDLVFVNDMTGYAVGGYGSSGYVLKTINKGETWISSLSTSTALQSVSFLNETTGYVVGGYNPVSLIYKTTNGGVNWIQQSSGTPYCYFDACFINENTGIIVGDWGNIRKTTNGGSTWYGCNSATPDYLESVFFINQNVGFSVGREGQMVKTTDGGNNWIKLFQTSTWLNSVNFLNQTTGYAVGNMGTIIKTTNGGNIWQIINTGLLTNFSETFFGGQNIIYVVGTYGNIIKSTNEGLNWTIQNTGISNDLSSVCFIDSLVGFVSGANASIYRTETGGEILPIAVLVSPPNNSNNVPLTPTLVWGEITSAINYLVEVSPLSNFSVIVDSATLTSYQRTIPEGKLQANTTYFWRVRVTNEVGTGPWTIPWSFGTTSVGINQISSVIPEAFKLYQNYPNPFNPVTKVKFDVPENTNINLKVYNISGKEVADLYRGNVKGGVFEVEWNAVYLSSGVYFLRFYSDKYTSVKKLILTK